MGVIEELEETIRRVAEKVGPSVVGIGDGWGQGSGVVVGEGLVLTNAHNVQGQKLRLTFSDGRKKTATVAGVDVDADVAVLHTETNEFPPVVWPEEAQSDQSSIRAGAVVFALANPGGRGVRTTFGVVSSVDRAFRGPRGRKITGSVEHSAPLPRGSSGGPIVDAEGRFLGLNTNRLGEGFYLAIPADAELLGRVHRLSRGEQPLSLRLGVGIVPPRTARQLRRAVGLPERDGLLVRVVEDDSPGSRAGIRSGDLLVRAAGQDLNSVDDLHAVLDLLAPGESLPLLVVRGTDEVQLAVTFGPTREEGTA